jgi:hypothetical protein
VSTATVVTVWLRPFVIIDVYSLTRSRYFPNSVFSYHAIPGIQILVLSTYSVCMLLLGLLPFFSLRSLGSQSSVSAERYGIAVSVRMEFLRSTGAEISEAVDVMPTRRVEQTLFNLRWRISVQALAMVGKDPAALGRSVATQRIRVCRTSARTASRYSFSRPCNFFSASSGSHPSTNRSSSQSKSFRRTRWKRSFSASWMAARKASPGFSRTGSRTMRRTCKATMRSAGRPKLPDQTSQRETVS